MQAPVTSGPLPSTSAEPVYAGFLRRIAAYFLDFLILAIPATALGVLLENDLLLYLALMAIWWLYKAGMESSGAQATLGKKAMCIKVAGLDGERVSFARASVRFISAVAVSIGIIMAAFTKRRQALHDLMASTLVVSSRATPSQIREGSGIMPDTRRVGVVLIVMVAFFIGAGMLGAFE